MKEFLFYDAVGEIKTHLRTSDQSEADQTAEALGLSYIESGPAHPSKFYVLDGVLTERPPSGPNDLEFQEITEPTLEAVQNRQWALIKQQRALVEIGGFTTKFGAFQSDAGSQLAIMQAAIDSNAPDWETEWTTKNNESVLLKGADIREVHARLVLFKGLLHQKSQAARALIYAEDATVQSVNAVALDLTGLYDLPEDEGEAT